MSTCAIQATPGAFAAAATSARKSLKRAKARTSSTRMHATPRKVVQSTATTPVAKTDYSADEYDLPYAPMEDLLPKGPWTPIEGGLTAPAGFKAAAFKAGLRASGTRADCALVVAEDGAVGAGVFTQNRVAAAPVMYCRDMLKESPVVRAVLINAGQANAATGTAGMEDACASARAVSAALGIGPEEVLLESTGVIGQRIKIDKFLPAIPTLAANLESSQEAAMAAATAICTTDLVRKTLAIEVDVGGGRMIKIGGISKGSGMIHPNMATMLGVITCDAPMEQEVWRKMLCRAAAKSFNQISVDGDTSTNDSVIALASGGAGGDVIAEGSAEAVALEGALTAVSIGLAKAIAWDGEGATCLIEVNVSGTETMKDAREVARSVVSSSLTKAAVFGHDPNWGRLACAAGYAGIPFRQEDMRIALGPHVLMEAGQPLPFDEKEASAYMKDTCEVHGTVQVDISVGEGEGKGTAWGCDLTYDYVKINAEYTT